MENVGSKVLSLLLVLAISGPLMGNEKEPEVQTEATTKTAEKKPDPVAVQPPKNLVPDTFLQLGQGDYYSDHAFLADKSRRTLTIWRRQGDDLRLVEAHPMDMGKKEGDKNYKGDLKTPEGIYFFQLMHNAKELNYDEYGTRAITMDYPNFYDKRERKTGSGIWLHGIPDTKTLYRGSRGCLVVRDEIINKLAKYVSLKRTPIIVVEKVNYIKPIELQKQRRAMLDWVNKWRASWTNKDIETYISHYGEKFRALGMNKKVWKRYKTELNEKYSYINVKIEKPMLLRFQDEVMVRFLQDYESSTVKDFGEKSLYLKKGPLDSAPLIIGEQWQAVDRPDDLLAKKTESSSQPDL